MIEEKNGIQGCPMYAIFATKLFLGVHEVLGIDHVRPFEELQATAKRCITTATAGSSFRPRTNRTRNGQLAAIMACVT
jgi:hypothetical protein